MNIKEARVKLSREAQKLTVARKETASRLRRAIERELEDLNFKKPQFECRIEPAEPHAKGTDQVTFFICTNPGEPLLPLTEVVSGGEASRIMLALKRALLDTDDVPTMLFDEIDANIGGRLGTVVGEKLKSIAAKHQVFLITHLPQIASFADCHIKVSKVVERGKTKTHYRIIEGEDRVRELAEMMSGEKKTKVATEHARELLEVKR